MSFLALEVIGGITFLGKRGGGVNLYVRRKNRNLGNGNFFSDTFIGLPKKSFCARVCSVSTHAMLCICTCVVPEVSPPRRAP